MYRSGCYSKLKNFVRSNEIFRKYCAISVVLEKLDVGDITEIKGWVKNLRIHKDHIFAAVSDRSCAQKLHIIIPKNITTDTLSYESSIHVIGKMCKSPMGQLELHADHVKVIGTCVVDDYPFKPKVIYTPEHTRKYLHLRSRIDYYSAILQIQSAVTKHIYDYFAVNNYTNIHTPILTSNDCEGAGEVFKIQPDSEETVKAMMQEGKDRDSVYFGSKTFLTVSGQLHLEAVCRGMGNVFTFGPTFRAENSRSRVHLSEFNMLEAELAFCETLEQLQGAIENLIKYVFIETRNTNEADLFLIDKENKAPSWVTKEFVTLTYDEARQILLKKGSTLTKEGINKEQELILVKHCNGVPVFVVKWPKDIKSFYMKECSEDNTKVDALDLLTPITGEVVSGSLREDNFEKLKSKLPSDRLNWYLELRKFGNIPTGGYGLGLERILQVICNVNNIKDTLPFPRWPHKCDM